MKKRVKKYTSQFKFQAVMESLVKVNVSEIARKYQVNANQLSNWRAEFKKYGHKLFDIGKKDPDIKYKKKISELENLIGKKEVELNLLKTYLDFYAPTDGV